MDYDAGLTAQWDQIHAEALVSLRSSKAFFLTCYDGEGNLKLFGGGTRTAPGDVIELLMLAHHGSARKLMEIQDHFEEEDDG